jgi:nitrogen regulatory protein P-II 1
VIIHKYAGDDLVSMKLVAAIIRDSRLDAVSAALEEAGYGSMTVIDVRGRGEQRGVRQQYRGTEYVIDLLPRVRVDLAVPDTAVEEVVDLICRTARTGEPGDGKVFVVPLDTAVRVRTGERGDAVL